MNGDRFTPIGLGHRAALMPDRDVTQVPMRQPAPGRGFPITHVTYERGAKGPSTVEFVLPQDWCRSMNVSITAQGVTVDGEPRRYEIVGDVMQIHGPLVVAEPLSPSHAEYLAVKDREQSAWEAWAERECPSGDADSVHSQWLASADYADFLAAENEPMQGDWAAKVAAALGNQSVAEVEAALARVARNHASRGPVTMEELKAELAKLPRRAEPPRRLDIRQDKPAFYTQFDVYLDGVKQSRAVVADADKGYLERYLPNPAPWLTRFARRTERKSGTVVIVWRDDPLPGA